MIETSTDNSFQILTISKENGFKYFVHFIKNNIIKTIIKAGQYSYQFIFNAFMCIK